MPRTFKATIALIISIIALALLTIFNVMQTNSAEKHILQMSQQIQAISQENASILRQLKDGVAVSGRAGGAGAASTDKYAAALNDPGNLLQARTEPLIPADAQEGGTLRRYMSSTPKGFNWLTENGADVQELATYVHNSFATRDPVDPNKWISELAYKIEVSDDNLVYTVHLREGVYWQIPNVDFSNAKYDWLKQEQELTAEDAVFYFDMIQNPQVQAGAIKSYFEDLDRAEVVSKYVFKVIWKKKVYQSEDMTLGSYPLPKWLFTKHDDGSPIPEASLGTQFNNHWSARFPIGTGPYKITDIETDKRIVLERNDRFWGPKPPIKSVEYQIIKDPNTAYLKLTGGKDLDLTTLPEPVYKQDVLEGGPRSPFKTGKLKYDVVTRPVYYYLGWNADKPIFADARVRRAMTHALDRQGIIDHTLSGLGKILTGPFLPDHPGNNPEVKAYPYDVDKAAQLLKEAGWEDTDGNGVLDKVIDGKKTEFRFTILAYNKPTTRSYLSIYKEALRKIGVHMTPSYLDWSLMQKKMDEREFDAFTGGWGLSWTTDPFQLWHSSQADVVKGSNRVGFRNKEADEIIEKLRVTFDTDERIELLRDFHMIMHKEQPYTFFYQLDTAFAWQPRMQNMVFQKLRPQDLSIPWWINQDMP